MEFTGYSFLMLCMLFTSVYVVKSTGTPDDNRIIKDEIASLITTSRFEFDELNKRLEPYIEMEHKISTVIAAIRRCRERNPNAYLGISAAQLGAWLDDASNLVKTIGNVSAYTKAASNELLAARNWNVWCWKELTQEGTKYTTDNLPYYCKLFYSHHSSYQVLMVYLYNSMAQIRHMENTLDYVGATCTQIEALMGEHYADDLAEARKMVINKWMNIVNKIDRVAKYLEADGNMDMEKAMRTMDDEIDETQRITKVTETVHNDARKFTQYAYTAKINTSKNYLERILDSWKGGHNGETPGLARGSYLLMTGIAALAVAHCF